MLNFRLLFQFCVKMSNINLFEEKRWYQTLFTVRGLLQTHDNVPILDYDPNYQRNIHPFRTFFWASNHSLLWSSICTRRRWRTAGQGVCIHWLDIVCLLWLILVSYGSLLQTWSASTTTREHMIIYWTATRKHMIILLNSSSTIRTLLYVEFLISNSFQLIIPITVVRIMYIVLSSKRLHLQKFDQQLRLAFSQIS